MPDMNRRITDIGFIITRIVPLVLIPNESYIYILTRIYIFSMVINENGKKILKSISQCFKRFCCDFYAN